MSEKLTVAELMARNNKDGGRTRADRPRRRRNLEDGGVSVSELTGSIPVVGAEDLDEAEQDAKDEQSNVAVADEHRHRGVHEVDDRPAAPAAAVADSDVSDASDVVDGEVVDDEPAVEEQDLTTETTVIPKTVPAAPAEPTREPAEEPAPAAVATAEADTAVAEEPAEPVDTVDSADTLDTADTEDTADSDEIIEYEDDAISWPALIGQTAIALVVGVVIFFGFTLLWDNLGTPLVLMMAVAVTLVCVGVVHALLRHRHALVLILAFIVGLVITLGPRLVMAV